MKSTLRLLILAIGIIVLDATLQADQPWLADPTLVAKLSSSTPEFLYDESRVPEFTLPDPLLGVNGTKVTDAAAWLSRRNETMELFRSHVYGRRPKLDYNVMFEVTEEIQGFFDGQATGRAINVTIASGAEKYSFPLLVFIPTKSKLTGNSLTGSCPAVVHINNHEFPTLATAITDQDGFWPVENLVKRGYVACAISTSAIDPDRADGFNEGLRGFFAKAAGAPSTVAGDDAWKALSAWGWGASRALDYLLMLDQVDKDRIALIGHSRGGKSALWAAAEDTRFAIVCSNNSGCGGAALSRRAYGETVARITNSFPHWFCDRFATYSGNESKLPIDQHQLIALIAPRPVYVTSASDDLWADPRGEYLSLVEAAPVYKLLGQAAIETREMATLDQARVVGKTGYHIRTGPHGLNEYDWEKYLDFCDKQWATD